MKSILDDSKTYSQYDSLDVYSSFANFPKQFSSSWHDSQFVSLNFDPLKINNIVYVGMGGSVLPANIVQSLSPLLLKTPFETISNYRLPNYVSKNTLVILVSYQGNTEEVLSCAQDATVRHCPVVILTAGGKIKQYALDQHYPIIVLDDSLNHSHLPRFGLGLLLGAVLGLIVRINPESYRHLNLQNIIHTIEKTLDLVRKENLFDQNPAKQIAQKNKGQGIIIFAANHLNCIGKIFSNFANESAKTFATYFSLPDLNHHFLDGLSYPQNLRDQVRFLLLNSNQYPEIIQKRLILTKEILVKQKFYLTELKPESDDIVSQTFESLVFFIAISYYLSIVNKQDPGKNPWVDYFKKQL